jgi:hypothetical protein
MTLFDGREGEDRVPELGRRPERLFDLPFEYQHAYGELDARTGKFQRIVVNGYRQVIGKRTDVAKRVRSLLDAREERKRREAALEAAEERLGRHPPTTGHPHDGKRRVLAKWLYLVILGGAGTLAYQIDKGALLVLLLPRSTTETIALFAVFLLLGAAHWSGHILRRRHQVIEARTVLGRPEVALGTLCLVAGYSLAVVVAAIRAADGGVLPGLLFLVLGCLDFTVALVASYFVTHDGVSAKEKAQRALDRQRRRERRTLAALQRDIGSWQSSCVSFRNLCGRVVSEADRILAVGVDTWRRSHPGGPAPAPAQPGWLLAVREIDAGELPPDLDIRPILSVIELEGAL